MKTSETQNIRIVVKMCRKTANTRWSIVLKKTKLPNGMKPRKNTDLNPL